MYFVVECSRGVTCFGVCYKIAGGGSQVVGGVLCQQRRLDDAISMDAQAGCMGTIGVVDSLRVSRGRIGNARFAHVELQLVSKVESFCETDLRVFGDGEECGPGTDILTLQL